LIRLKRRASGVVEQPCKGRVRASLPLSDVGWAGHTVPIWKATGGKVVNANVAECATGVSVKDADLGAVRANLDARARTALNIDGATFLSNLKAGVYDGSDTPAISRLRAIASLLD
jgi:hypothetical protein